MEFQCRIAVEILKQLHIQSFHSYQLPQLFRFAQAETICTNVIIFYIFIISKMLNVDEQIR